MKLRISSNARRNLKEIVTYISADKPSAALKWRNSFYEKCALLKSAPEIGILRNDIREGLRILPFGNYLILYHVNNIYIDIVHLFHGAQDWQNLL